VIRAKAIVVVHHDRRTNNGDPPRPIANEIRMSLQTSGWSSAKTQSATANSVVSVMRSPLGLGTASSAGPSVRAPVGIPRATSATDARYPPLATAEVVHVSVAGPHGRRRRRRAVARPSVPAAGIPGARSSHRIERDSPRYPCQGDLAEYSPRANWP
jgi:hypothetical protein